MKITRPARRQLSIIAIFFLFIPFMSAGPSWAADNKKYFDTLSIYWENDFISGTDRDYTNGLKFTWSTPFKTEQDNEKLLPKWSYPVINHLPLVDNRDDRRALSISLGQDIYTPQDTGRLDVDPEDRPYAGYTYLAAGFHSKTFDRKNSWEFAVGIIGPLSFAEQMQNGGHDLIGSNKAEGWENQLKNEPTIEATFESQWRLFSTGGGPGFNSDFITHLGGSLGTVRIHANVGGEMRFGWNLPGNFGSCPIRSGCDINSAFNEGSRQDGWGLHFFVAADGRGVARDIFLDGNTFKGSHSVEKEILVADLMTGFAVERGSLKTTYSLVYRSRQFETQEERSQIFGALSLSWGF